MKLKQYLQEEDISAAKFARRIQVSSVKVGSILKEDSDSMLSIALRIQKETKGKVKPSDLLPEEFWQKNNRKNRKIKN